MSPSQLFHDLNYLKYEQAEKVEVGCPLELLKQVEGQEGDQGVLGGLDKVVLEKG